jgi:hypothetical protein
MLTEDIKSKLIQAAIYAPSADNSQPFLYEWKTDNQLSLFIDPSRSGKASDNRFVLSDIALGAVIENTVITAHANKLSIKETFFPTEGDEYHVCDIEFYSSDKYVEADLELEQFIQSRTTDRRFPFKGNIDQQTLEILDQTASHYGCSTKWYNNKIDKEKVLPVIQRAESIRFMSKILHQELFSTVHFGNPDSEEGMPIEVLAIEKPAQPFFKWIKKWSVMSFFNKIGAYKLLGIRSVKLPILFSPSLALITIDGNSRASVINGGRALQRFWLKATQLGISTQPYAAPGIFSLGFIACEPGFQQSLKEVKREMANIVPEGSFGLMFFRLGMNSTVKNRTNRRKINTFKKLR